MTNGFRQEDDITVPEELNNTYVTEQQHSEQTRDLNIPAQEKVILLMFVDSGAPPVAGFFSFCFSFGRLPLV